MFETKAPMPNQKQNLIVIGNGMVGHRFLELMVEKDGLEQWNLITFCEEPRVAYDRVHLSEYFVDKTADDLSLVQPDFYQSNGIQICGLGAKLQSWGQKAFGLAVVW